MGRKFIRIPLLIFSPGSSPSDFHKTSEDPNCLIKEDHCKNKNIFGRHASDGPNIERNFASKGDIDFSVTKFRFCDKFKKSQLTPVKEIEFFGLAINSVNMTLALPQEKVLYIQNKCTQLIASPKTTIIELTQLLGKLLFTSQAELPESIQCRYLEQQQIQAVRETNSYQTKIKLNQQSQADLKWWKENLLLRNNKPLKIGMPQLVTQTDASKTGWGQSIKEPPGGGLGHIRKGQNISMYWSSL